MAISAPTGSARRPLAADQDRAARMRALLRTLRPEGLDTEAEDAGTSVEKPGAPATDMTPGSNRVAATLMGNPGPRPPVEPKQPLTAGLKMPRGPGPYGSDEEGAAGPPDETPEGEGGPGGDEDAAASARMRRRMRRRGTVA